MISTFLAALAVFPWVNTTTVLADEGMWTLNAFPSVQVQKKYGFGPSKQWLDHVRLSSARLARGCSGSFVSASGLIMTNHHCAHACIEQLSTAKKDFVASGFYAKTDAEEVKCPEIEINQLTDISDVTARIQNATVGLNGQLYNAAQKSEMSKIEKECAGGSEDLRCDVVTLYHGGQYNLYKYKRYQDVRLVFAPEFSIAFFGGDPDNFNFPRYDLDLSFLRVYQGGKPLKTENYFRWSSGKAADGELTFVTGHPGKTSRLLTIAELEFQRDHFLSEYLLYLSEFRGFLTEFQNRGPEPKRISTDILFSVENSLKALKGRQQALMNKSFFGAKVSAELSLRKKINSNPRWKKEYGSAWKEIAAAQDALREIYKPLTYIENGRGFRSTLYQIAKKLVRSATELSKPNEKRFREFADSALPQFKQDLFSNAPLYEDLEIAELTFSLTKLREELGADDLFVKKLLGNRSPAEIAATLVKGSRLREVGFRRSLFEGGQSAVLASQDPMVAFARLVDPEARVIRKNYEDNIESVLKKQGERIGRAQFAVFGTHTYPDATFTLRMSYGQIKGYIENGHSVGPLTTLGGAFDRNSGSAPFALPESWLKAKSSLDLNTPFNFCSTNDIIGGNSGSPVINKQAEIVGLIFDGNIQSLGGEYGFDGTVNRAVAVHSAAMIETLKKIYGADRVVHELTENRPGTAE